VSSSRDPLDHAFWLASRSAGMVAFLLLTAAVAAGLVMALRLAPVPARAMLREGHERLALLGLGAVAAHMLFLLGDSYLNVGLVGVLVPFATPYRPLWTGLGILAAYLAAGLSLTYYARARLGTRRWRTAHRFVPIAWGIAAIHILGAGTDARSMWLLVPYSLALSAVAVLMLARLSGERPVPAAATRVPAPAPPAPAPPRPARLWSTERRPSSALGERELPRQP
jgi:sulfoxide reductase heme-binding subunit YedZ